MLDAHQASWEGAAAADEIVVAVPVEPRRCAGCTAAGRARFGMSRTRQAGHPGARSPAASAPDSAGEDGAAVPRTLAEAGYADQQVTGIGRHTVHMIIDAPAGPSQLSQCRLRYFAGLAAIGRGERDRAAAHFRAAVATGAHWRQEYQWSRAFLARLQQDPTWPARIQEKSAAVAVAP